MGWNHNSMKLWRISAHISAELCWQLGPSACTFNPLPFPWSTTALEHRPTVGRRKRRNMRRTWETCRCLRFCLHLLKASVFTAIQILKKNKWAGFFAFVSYVSWVFQQFSAIFDNVRQFSAIFDNVRQFFAAIFGHFRQFSAIIQQFSAIFHISNGWNVQTAEGWRPTRPSTRWFSGLSLGGQISPDRLMGISPCHEKTVFPHLPGEGC